MRRLRLFSVPVRFFALWAGIILCGGYAAHSQEKSVIDTLHLFNAHADTVWVGFDEVLPLSATGDSNFHYLYRWFYKGKKIGEENILNYSFTGERKVKVIGQRLSTALPWPGEEYLDMEYFKDGNTLERDFIDTIYLKAFSEYESDSTAKWIWTVKAEAYDEREYTLFGPRIKFTYDNNETNFVQGYTVTCTLLTETEEKHTPEGHIKFWSDYRVRKMRLTDSGRRGAYYMNVWDIESARIYAHKEDTLYFDGRSSKNPVYSEWSQANVTWTYHEKLYRTPSFHISFDGAQYKDFLDYYGFISLGNGNGKGQKWFMYVYWGIDPDAEIESDSVWVFFPQYPYSDLGDRVDICLPPDAPLPSPDDTVQTFNLGSWNRELDYVEYAWFDGTKDISGHDSVVGTDSAFAYLFGRMDSVSPYLYAGILATRVAADSLWQDSCACFVPCTDDACHRYDTVRIYLHRLPEHNTFFPRDTFLCAHLDLELNLSDTAENYRCFWLDRDSIEMPYGHDTARFTIQGMRGTDGFGAGTDTREPRLFQLRLEHKLCGVSYFDTLRVTDIVKPAFTLLCHDTIICLDEPVELDSLSPLVYLPAYTFQWTDGEKGSSRTFTDSGNYVLQFFVKEVAASCGYDTATDTLRVLWSDPAMTIITLPADTGFCPKLSVTLDASVSCAFTRYEWRMGAPLEDEEDYYNDFDSVLSTLPTRTFKEEGTFNISLIDTLQCRNVKEINITEDDCTPKLDIPNVFTPNGDGVNDIWRFRQLESCRDVVVEVVDRWGQPVLKQKVPSADAFEWNGTMHGKGRLLPDGPYFYMVSYKDVYGKRHTQSGSVTILGTSE